MVRAAAVLVALAAVAVVVSGCGDGERTVRVVSLPPVITPLDVAPRGKSPGDVYVIRSVLLDGDERSRIGRLRGVQASLGFESGAETVQAQLTFVLGPGDEIVVGGLSQYPARGAGSVIGRRFVRPVLGGTGEYAGAKGELVTVRRRDNRYEQAFKLDD